MLSFFTGFPFGFPFGFNFVSGVVFVLTMLAWVVLIGYVIPRMEVSGKAKFWMIVFSVLFATQAFIAAGLVITGSVFVTEGGEVWAWALIAASFAVLTAMWVCVWDFVDYWIRRRYR